MNAAIASASLLGFGDKPASEAMSSFAKTLEKLYSSQEKEHKKEDATRRSTIEKYNEQDRAKKKKKSDFQGFLSKLRGDGEGEGVGKKKEKGGMGLLGILGVAAIGSLAATALAPVIIGKVGEVIFNGLKDKVSEMIDPIVESVETPIKEKFEEVQEGWDGIVSFVKEKLGLENEEEEKEGQENEGAEEEKEKEPTPAEAVAEAVTPPPPPSPEKEESTPAAEVSEAVQPSVPQEGGNTAWDPVLEMISSAESRGRYDIMYGGEIVDGITEMTIAEAAKRAGDRGDGKNYAVGKYQFITLVKQAEAAGLDPNKDLFSPKNQDKIAIDLITRKRKVTIDMAKKNPKEAGKRLAMEWAGLPVLAPTKGHKRDIDRGQSYYAGDGVNKSTITPEQVEGSFQKLQKGGKVKAPKDKNDPRTKLGVMENRNFEVKSPLLQGKKRKAQKRQKGGLVLFAGHQDVPIGHSQPGTDAPGTPLEGKYKPTAEQHFANEVGVATQALAQQKNVPISYRPARGRYENTSNPNSNWAQITQIRNQGGSAIDLHFDAYGYDKSKLIVGSRGVIANGFTLSNIEKEIQSKFGRHPSGTRFEVPILELDPINKAPGNSQTYAQMIVSAVQNVVGGGGPTTETATETTTETDTETTTEITTEKVTEVPQGSAGAARGTNPPSLTVQPKKEKKEEDGEENVKGVEAILKSAEQNVGIGAGQSMQCANTTRQVLRAAGHPDANKTTKKGDLDPEGLKYSGPSFAASFAGTDMGQIKKSVGSLEAGDIVLWKNTFNAMGGNKPGAITHVGIKGRGTDVYDHGSGPGWRKRPMWDGGKFAYGVNLSGTGGATGIASEDFGNNDITNVTGSISDVSSGGLGATSTGNPIDDAISEVVGEILAPLVEALGSLFGKPLKETSEGDSASSVSSGGGGGGSASSVADVSLGSTEYISLMKETMDKGGITNKNERIMFMAQVGHESGEGRYMEEIASGAAYEGRSDLGNTQPGDGKRYKGRGYIQITGRANYEKYGPMIGVPDAVENPEKLAQPQNAAKVALAYWLDRVDRSAAQRGMDGMTTVTRNINGGTNGIDDRIAKFHKYSKMQEIQQPSAAKMQKGGPVENIVKPVKLQQGGMVGQQINTGSMRGAQNTRMLQMKQMSQQMKRRGPKVIRVTAPPTPAPAPSLSGDGGLKSMPTSFNSNMSAGKFADYTHKIAMGVAG